VKWHKVTYPHNIPLREGRAIKVGGEELAIFNLGEEFVAVDNRCPHQGGPLADGIVTGEKVVCPLHSWRICLRSGAILKPALPVRTPVYPVRIVDGIIEVELPS